jgi:hypothetical protein
MKHQERRIYPAILAVIIVGLITFGVPASAMAYAALALICPLVMIFMPGVVGTGRAVATTERVAALATPERAAAPRTTGQHVTAGSR